MGQLIVHPGTGTVVNADECLVLDEDQIGDELVEAIINRQDIDETLVQLALRVGSPIMREI